jgi:hypothetical protein
MSDCYYDSDGCLVCPEQKAQAYVPAHIDHRAVVGWNAGANSITTLDGNLHTVFNAPSDITGLIVGLKGVRSRQTLPDGIEHGWYFQALAGAHMARVIERSVGKTSAASYTASDVFEVRRVNGKVTYLKNGVAVYTSTSVSSGAKVVNCCLYASGDYIGATT